MQSAFFVSAKRFAAAILAAAVMMCAVGCENDGNTLEARDKLTEDLYGAVELQTFSEQEEADATTSNFTLPYAKSDTLNPYTCTSTLNSAIGDLMYDSLLVVTGNYEAEPHIAQKIVQSSSSLILTVTLRSGIVFSDGSPLTAEDVKYSFQAAKAEGSNYASQLRALTACSVSENTVYFRIAGANPMAYMLLDFPIIKASSDADGSVPIGSGRYCYYNSSEKGTYLVRNEFWYSRDISDIERISLVAMPTVESIVHSVEIGTISYFFTDLRDGYPSRLNANYSMVDLNNVVYIGMNTNDPRLGTSEVRTALSLAIDREQIATSSFSGRAYAATGPFTTSWLEAASSQYGSTLAAPSGALASLSTAGYIYENENYIRRDQNGRTLSFSLIVSADNAQHVSAANNVADSLRAVGINITVYPISPQDLITRIAEGSYELYLGEYSITANMDISALFTPGSGLYTGPVPEFCSSAYNNYLQSQATLAEFVEAFDMDTPYIPLCFRLGMVCYSRALTANMNISESNLFLNMHEWKFAAAGQ